VIKPIAIVNVSWSADHRVIDGATIGKLCYDGDYNIISDSYHASDDDHSNDDDDYNNNNSQILECLEAAYRASRNDADDSSLVDSPTK